MQLKIILLYLFIILSIFITFNSCTTDNIIEKDNITIVCTAFPHYDWLCEIIGDNPCDIELVLLLDKGLDIHNYQPSTNDIITISTCDMFIYVGGESDSWVGDVLKTALNNDMIIINLMGTMSHMVKEEEVIEGMEAETDDEVEYDEHFWLSLKNAQYACSFLAAAIGGLDNDNIDMYMSNMNAYCEKLDALDKKYESMISEASCKVLLFGDRFPFRYLVDDYNLDYYAAFTGCSAETEASFETITFLVDKLNEFELKNIMVVETSDQSIAKTLVENSNNKNQSIYVLNSMQSVTASDIENGLTYLSIMEDNFEVLKEVLN